MLDPRMRKNLDTPLLLITLGIIACGLVTLSSASRASGGGYAMRQAVWAAIGLASAAVAMSVDCSRISRVTRTIYGAMLVLLIYVARFGSHAKGAQRWISVLGQQFQPSEVAKLAIILCLAYFLTRRHDRMREAGVFAGSFGYILVPMLLIFKQPDLGTALVILAIWFGMTFVAGARIKHITVFVLTGMLLAAGAWQFNILKPYQKDRLINFIYPETDPAAAGYHVKQSRIAIGSGRLWGKGYAAGTQVQGRFIPEKHTDFVFAVVGEEGGFVASVFLVVLYAGLLWRGVAIAAQTDDLYSKLIATGIVSMYAFHIFVNIGMTMGIMPVTGVPLPLMSYGGTNVLLNLTAIGVLLGIGMRRQRLVF